MTTQDVERCLSTGRDALVHLAELVSNGDWSRGEIFVGARAEAEALTELLEEAPENMHGKIQELLERYAFFMAGLVN